MDPLQNFGFVVIFSDILFRAILIASILLESKINHAAFF
jgi:hypothetical protein